MLLLTRIVPQTSNRTYEDLDILFARGVPARQFKDYVITDEDNEVTQDEVAKE